MYSEGVNEDKTEQRSQEQTDKNSLKQVPKRCKLAFEDSRETENQHVYNRQKNKIIFIWLKTYLRDICPISDQERQDECEVN